MSTGLPADIVAEQSSDRPDRETRFENAADAEMLHDAAHASLGMEEAFVLGYNVERLRRTAHLDIATFARMVGVTRPTIYKVERGASDLKLSFIKRFADALNVSVVELLSLPKERPLYLPMEDWLKECSRRSAGICKAAEKSALG